MMIKYPCILCALALFFSAHSQTPYPLTKKINQSDNYHGTIVEDPYRWLENDTSQETKEWAIAQNEVTFGYLDKIPFRKKMKDRIAELYNYARFSAPFRNGDFFYYYKNDGLQNQSVLYRQKGLEGEPELVLDPNKLSADGTTQLTDFELSKDGRYAAWGISRGGSDWKTYFVKDMSTLKDLPDTLNWVKVSEIGWQKNGFYYSRYPSPAPGMELSSKNENHQVWFHIVGTPQQQDKLVYEDTSNLQRFHQVYTDEEERFAFLTISDRGKGLRGNAFYYMENGAGDHSFKPIIGEVGDFQYGLVAVVNGKFLIETNENAPNKKVQLFDPGARGAAWKTIIAEKPEQLESAEVAGDKLFVQYMKDVTSRVFVHAIDGKPEGEAKLPGLGTASGFKGLKNDKFVFYTFTSFNIPPTVYRYDIASGKSTLFRKPELLFNPGEFVVKQEFYSSKDGTKIPMFLVHKKSVKMDGANPTLLYGYGGFNIALPPFFSISLIAFLEQGGVYALANLRGGSEYGEKWHEAGMLDKKQNVFDDCIAAAEYLIRKKYTSNSKLALRGGSNGGLLVGAVINQRPELFKVAIPEVGVMDMLRFHKFTIGWNWIPEYGTSEKPADFKYLYAYSPLHNIRHGANYPATLIVTADHDDRVVPAHSFKYAATMQEKYTGNNPVLIRIDTNSGHGASNIMKNIELAADVYSFTLYNLGETWKEIKR